MSASRRRRTAMVVLVGMGEWPAIHVSKNQQGVDHDDTLGRKISCNRLVSGEDGSQEDSSRDGTSTTLDGTI